MGGLSPVHLVIFMAIALIVFGPKKLPEIGKGIGQALREFTKAKNDFMNTLQSEMDGVEHAVRDTPPVAENSYSTTQQASAPGTVARSGAHSTMASAESADAMPYGGDFHASEGDSQPAFRTAQPDSAPAAAAVHHDSHLSQLASAVHPGNEADGVSAGKA